MVKLVKVFVEPRVVKGSVTPVCDIVLNGDKIYIIYFSDRNFTDDNGILQKQTLHVLKYLPQVL